MKLYILSATKEGLDTGDTTYYLMTEKGEALASHWCSSIAYAKGDLIENRPKRIEKWKKEFGKLEVIRLGQDEMTFKKLIELNHKLHDEQKEDKKNDC